VKRSLVIGLIIVATMAGCSRLGTGLPSCRIPASNPNAAMVLSLQAVPEAEYSPCVNALPLGWEEVDFEVESGLATLDFRRSLEPFLKVSLTPECDPGEAVEVPSGLPDVRRFEDIYQVTDAIAVTIIPDGERPRIYALSLAAEMEGTTVDDRPVSFTVDEDTQYSVRSRVNRALFSDQFVWIIGDLDIDEKTLELRASPEGEGAHGIDIDEALERMADMSEEVQYRGEWYLVFDGGCITYKFDAEGTLAASIADDADATVGIYPNQELIKAARSAGFDVDGGVRP
jgi:hypothetical protein